MRNEIFPINLTACVTDDNSENKSASRNHVYNIQVAEQHKIIRIFLVNTGIRSRYKHSDQRLAIVTSHKLNNFNFPDGKFFLYVTINYSQTCWWQFNTVKQLKWEWIILITKGCYGNQQDEKGNKTLDRRAAVRKFQSEESVNWQYNILAG